MKVFRLIGIVFLIFITGCNNYTNYAKDGPFISVRSSSASMESYEKSYPITYAVYENGTLILSTDPLKKRGRVIDEDPPEHEVTIDNEKVKEIQSLIEKNNFWKMAEDISIESEDGGYIYVTVHLTDESKTVGGLNPKNDDFLEIQQYVSSVVPSSGFKKWSTQVEEYLLEHQ